ncbi:MAG TPA: hypothetical protein VMF06_04795, partial [Candidatus Limnocylindria bacterium]|nr:hypothetical protein [Candidatus Limnocylindria bacterium]
LTTLEWVVVDTDILPDGSLLRELANLGVGVGGNGEVLWIQEGEVVAAMLSSKAGVEPLIVQRTIALLG